MDQNLLAFLLDTRPGFTVRKAQELDTFLSEFKAWTKAKEDAEMGGLTEEEAEMLDAGTFVKAVVSYRRRTDTPLRESKEHVLGVVRTNSRWEGMFPQYR